jgi:hypothetical protein
MVGDGEAWSQPRRGEESRGRPSSASESQRQQSRGGERERQREEAERVERWNAGRRLTCHADGDAALPQRPDDGAEGGAVGLDERTATSAWGLNSDASAAATATFNDCGPLTGTSATIWAPAPPVSPTK